MATKTTAQWPTDAKPTPDRVETTVIHFEGDDSIVFEPVGENGMSVSVTGVVVPEFNGPMFTGEFMDFLRERGVSGFAMDMMYDGVKEGLRKGALLDILMARMR